MMMLSLVLSLAIGCILLSALELVVRYLFPLRSLKGTHVIVVGGSSGIGKSLASLAGIEGARAVTIMSRSQSKLDKAKGELALEVSSRSCCFSAISCDVTNSESVESAIKQASELHGAADYVVCCAGEAKTGYFVDQDISEFRDAIELNYLGTVNCVKAVLPSMLSRNKGHIVLVSSAAGISGWIGYSSYTPTKFAVRGLADCLRNELAGFKDVNVSIAYPPDTATPGFERENLTKPRETLELFPPDQVFSAQVVATYIWDSVRKGDFHCSCPDHLANALISFMAGVTPRRLYLLECLTQPILFVASSLFRVYADFIASRYASRMKKQPPTAQPELAE